MLQSLYISNYALIDSLEIELSPGLNIITGETGAGKSIMMGALSLLLGARADSTRNSGGKTVIEGVFDVGAYPSFREYCGENDIEWSEDSRCILRREIAANGRSRAFVNDSPVPVGTLGAVALQLIDIHSQHQNQLLSRPAFQLQIIDTLASNDSLLERYSAQFTAFRSALKRLKVAKARIARSRDDEEFLRFQLEQLDELDPVEGELEELEKRHEVVANMAAIKTRLYDALQALSEGDINAISAIDTVSDACADLDNVLDEDDDIPARLEAAGVELRDIADTLAAIDRDLAADPAELEEIESRISDLNNMLAKHKVDTVEELISVREQLRKRLDDLDCGDETLASLEKEARRALALAKETASELSGRRKRAATALAAELVGLATPLGMRNLQVEVAVEPEEISATGVDKVTFRAAFNKNQQLMPVGAVASGGEMSRLMLCLKAVIARKMKLPTVIFDEIDTGVSGEVAARIGAMMEAMGDSMQVIAITHLPQVASRGRNHFKVYKEDDANSTHTRVKPLGEAERIDEIALMLSGESGDESARATAAMLLGNNSQGKTVR